MQVGPNCDDGYSVGFGESEGRRSVTMLAKLNEGANGSSADDWRASVLSTSADWEASWLVGPDFGDRGPSLLTITPYFADADFAGYVISPGSDIEQFGLLGFESGDILTMIDGVAVPCNFVPLSRRFQELTSGETIHVTISRGPDRNEIEIGLRQLGWE